MIIDLQSDQIRIPKDMEDYLKKLASNNGQTFSKIKTKTDLLKAFIKTLPQQQAYELLNSIEQYKTFKANK
ncbi:MAG: hypothetical protein ACC653_08795 [Gammaproteobacteria bacterium]